ncbi:MAG: helix-turn-helix transcriptional regulator [Myxococcota bacterium]
MLHAAHTSEFVQAPVGRYVTGRTWLIWCVDVTLCGLVVWGRLDEGEVGRLLVPNQAFFGLATPEQRGVLADASRLERIDAAAFSRFARFVGDRLPDCESRTERQAFVRPPGFLGALVAGFYEVCGHPSYPVHTFTDAADALRWLGRGDVVALSEEIAALVVAASATPHAVRDLRELLSTDLRLPLGMAARRLGTSERSLQRELRRAGTSFRAEVDEARIRAAEILLAETDLKITSIALQVGCASLQHFSAFVRRLTGQTPSAWRAKLRSVASA